MAQNQWAGSTFGSGRLHSALIRSLRIFDVRFIYAFAFVFVIPFVVLFSPSRKTSWRFYRGILGFGRLKSALYVFLNHCMFAEVVIDRFAMYAGKKFDVVIEGEADYMALASRPEGFVQLSSHIGNYEIAGYSLLSPGKTINAVVYGHEKESVMRNRSAMFDRTNIRMICIREDMGHLFEIERALSEGNVVSLPADRHMGGSKTVECSFLGHPADFPKGPFSVAVMCSLDVLAVNVMKEGAKRYRIYVTPLRYDRGAPRKEQMRGLCGAYVAELEKRVEQYPAQWYNFFDFWK